MINPARFTQNYNVASNSVVPGPKAIRQGSVSQLVEKVKATVGFKPPKITKFMGKPLPL